MTHSKSFDVRTKEEFEKGHIENAINIDFINNKRSLKKLDRKKTYLIYCQSGRRSQLAMDFLKEQGFTRLFNMRGGLLQWKQQFPSLIPSQIRNLYNYF